jgi:hypothetical protein
VCDVFGICREAQRSEQNGIACEGRTSVGDGQIQGFVDEIVRFDPFTPR